MEKFVIIITIIVGLALGFGLKILLGALGANVFLPSSIIEIYVAGVVIAFLVLYYILKYKESKQK